MQLPRATRALNGLPDDITPPASRLGEPARPLGDAPLLGEAFVADVLAAQGARPAHDARVAYALAAISAWSYSDPRTLSRKLHFYGLPGNTVAGFSVTNHALFVVATAYVVRSRCGRLAIIAFRGTEPINLASWLTDADVITQDVPASWNARGEVHRGFLANLEAVWDDVEDQLGRTPEGAAPVEAIYITGHSLGGAMAVLAAAQLLRSPDRAARLRGVYTYGQPAVGDHAFAAWGSRAFGEILFRHVYNRDLVPRLPPRSTGRFEHFGVEYHSRPLPRNGAGPEQPPEGWSKRPAGQETGLLRFVLLSAGGAVLEFATRRTQWLSRLRFPSSIDDHFPAFYLKTSRDHAHAMVRPGVNGRER